MRSKISLFLAENQLREFSHNVPDWNMPLMCSNFKQTGSKKSLKKHKVFLSFVRANDASNQSCTIYSGEICRMRETVNPIEGVYIKNCGPLIPGNEITGWLGGIRPGRKKNWYRVTPLLSFIAVTKVTSNTRTRKEHLFAEERIYHINYGVLQGFPALRKAITTNVKKYKIFWRVFDIANQLLNVTRLYSVRLINERQSLHHSLSRIVCWNVFGLWLKNTRITLSLTDSDVRTFPEGEEEKPKVTYSVALVLAFLAAKNENRQLEDLPQADFCCVPWRFLLSVRTNCRNTFYHYIFFFFWSHAPRKKN